MSYLNEKRLFKLLGAMFGIYYRTSGYASLAQMRGSFTDILHHISNIYLILLMLQIMTIFDRIKPKEWFEFESKTIKIIHVTETIRNFSAFDVVGWLE